MNSATMKVTHRRSTSHSAWGNQLSLWRGCCMAGATGATEANAHNALFLSLQLHNTCSHTPTRIFYQGYICIPAFRFEAIWC